MEYGEPGKRILALQVLDFEELGFKIGLPSVQPFLKVQISISNRSWKRTILTH